jgi:hypothetical protein
MIHIMSEFHSTRLIDNPKLSHREKSSFLQCNGCPVILTHCPAFKHEVTGSQTASPLFAHYQ